MLLIQKCHFFHYLLSLRIRVQRFNNVLDRKESFFDYKIFSKKSQKSYFFKGSWFCDILERKNAFLGYKNSKFKKSKNWDFSKDLGWGFGPKLAIFQFFFLGNIGQETVFYNILERENTSLGYKNEKFKKLKN